MSTPSDQRAAMTLIMVVAEAVRQAGEIPSGHLYATVMGSLSLEAYNTVIERLKKAKLIKEENYLIKWVGPNHICPLACHDDNHNGDVHVGMGCGNPKCWKYDANNAPPQKPMPKDPRCTCSGIDK